MARPRMIVVAGPPGSGKTTYFPITAFHVDAFSIDDRCAQIHGSVFKTSACTTPVKGGLHHGLWLPRATGRSFAGDRHPPGSSECCRRETCRAGLSGSG